MWRTWLIGQNEYDFYAMKTNDQQNRRPAERIFVKAEAAKSIIEEYHRTLRLQRGSWSLNHARCLIPSHGKSVHRAARDINVSMAGTM